MCWKETPFSRQSALKAARRWIYRPLTTAAGAGGVHYHGEMKFTLHYRGQI